MNMKIVHVMVDNNILRSSRRKFLTRHKVDDNKFYENFMISMITKFMMSMMNKFMIIYNKYDD